MTGPQPSEAAMRAAEAIVIENVRNGVMPNADARYKRVTRNIAAIIERETRCGEMREALEYAKESLHLIDSGRYDIPVCVKGALDAIEATLKEPTP